MFKKIISLLSLLAITLFAEVDFNPHQTTIQSVDKDIATVANNPKVALGATGVVMRQFEGPHKTIISSVEVIKKEADTMQLKLTPFKAIAQKALPSYSIKVAKGDDVILNFLYNKAMAIVPDEATYKIVTKSYDAFIWSHPDIFASKLAKSYNPTPTKETFQEECIAENIGILLFAIKGQGHFVDCQSFATLSTIPLPAAQSVQSPFFSRVETIKGRIFGLFGGKGVSDYDNFYTELLKK